MRERNRMGKVHLNKIVRQDKSKSTKNPEICYTRAHENSKETTSLSQAMSPLLHLMQRCQLLSREKRHNTLKSCASDENLCAENRICLPDLQNERCLSVASAAIPNKMRLSVGANPTPFSVSAPVSPVPKSRNTEMLEDLSRVQSTHQDDDEDQICGKEYGTNQTFMVQRPEAKLQPLETQQPPALLQTVFLPKRVRGSKTKNENTEDENTEDETSEDQSNVNCKVEVESLQVKRCRVRSHSAAAITSEDLKSISEHNRAKKPWNEWRRISEVARNERGIVIGQIRAGGSPRKKSFELWLAEKEIMRNAATSKTIEDSRLKKIAKEKLEEERKLRCKSYQRWLAEKGAAAEGLKEMEKKKEIEKKTAEDELHMRKIEAERKYEKWMREKYKEELRKEEELQRFLEEKWKMKQEEKERRKSAPVKTTLLK